MGFSSRLGTTSNYLYTLAVLCVIVFTSVLISSNGRETVRIVLEPYDYSNSDAETKGTTLHDNSNSDVRINGTTLHDNEAPGIKTVQPTTQRNGCSILTKYSETFDRQEVKHWQPDWFTSGDTMKIMLEKRRVGIIDRCSTLKQCTYFQGRKKASGYKKQILHAGKLLNCATFKAGYTFWRHTLERLRNERIKTTPMKFTVTRNPWHRLVSVWQDRLSGAHGNPTAVMKQFCRGKTWPSMPSFRQFVEDCLLANWKFGRMNAHWAPVLERCQVCDGARSFHFFLAQENMNEEASYMLRKLDVENVTKLLTTVQSRSLREGEGHRPSYQQFYKNISSQTINKLRQIYKFELYLFDYPDSPFVDFDRA